MKVLVLFLIFGIAEYTSGNSSRCKDETAKNNNTADTILKGVYVPQCKDDGSYEKMQCYGSTGSCWCVDSETGIAISGTKRVPGDEKPNCEDVCNLPPVTRSLCKARLKSWYYDPANGRCKKFVYGGCGGNGNNFKSRKECWKVCHCRKPICEMFCSTGYQTGRNGCRICKCKPSILQQSSVPKFSVSIQIVQGYPIYSRRGYTNVFPGYSPFVGFPNLFNEFPGSLRNFSRTVAKPRVYGELKLKTKEHNSKFVPQICIATSTPSNTPSKSSSYRREIIRNGKPIDKTFIRHTTGRKVYRFSITAFNVATIPRVFIRCKSLIIFKNKFTKYVAVNDYVEDEGSDPEISYYSADSTAKVERLKGIRNKRRKIQFR